MRAIHDLNGYSAVFLPGDSPTFVIKSASSPPQLISLNEKSVQSLSGLNTPTCERGFAYIDQIVSQMSVRWVLLINQVRVVSNLHNCRQTAIITRDGSHGRLHLAKTFMQLITMSPQDPMLLVSATKPISSYQKTRHTLNGVPSVSNLYPCLYSTYLTILSATSFLPQVEQGTVKLLDQTTWSIIDEQVKPFPHSKSPISLS